jgi:hypothetical protein
MPSMTRYYSTRFRRAFVACVDRRLHRTNIRVLLVRKRTTPTARSCDRRVLLASASASASSRYRLHFEGVRLIECYFRRRSSLAPVRRRSPTDDADFDPDTPRASAARRCISASVPLSPALRSWRWCRLPRIDCDAPSATSRDVYQHV